MVMLGLDYAVYASDAKDKTKDSLYGLLFLGYLFLAFCMVMGRVMGDLYALKIKEQERHDALVKERIARGEAPDGKTDEQRKKDDDDHQNLMMIICSCG